MSFGLHFNFEDFEVVALEVPHHLHQRVSRKTSSRCHLFRAMKRPAAAGKDESLGFLKLCWRGFGVMVEEVWISVVVVVVVPE